MFKKWYQYVCITLVWIYGHRKNYLNNPYFNYNTTHQPLTSCLAVCGLTWDFLQTCTCYSERSHIHWDETKLHWLTKQMLGLFLHHAPLEGTTSPDLHHSLWTTFVPYGCKYSRWHPVSDNMNVGEVAFYVISELIRSNQWYESDKITDLYYTVVTER